MVAIRDGASPSAPLLAEYTYDPLNRRIEKTWYSGGQSFTTRYYYDGPHAVVEADTADTVDAEYLYGANIDEVLVMWTDYVVDNVREPYYYHTDRLGSTVMITDGNGAKQECYARTMRTALPRCSTRATEHSKKKSLRLGTRTCLPGGDTMRRASCTTIARGITIRDSAGLRRGIRSGTRPDQTCMSTSAGIR